MQIVDCHCHLESIELFQHVNKILKDADDAGIIKIITSPVTPDQWKTSKSLAHNYKKIEYTIGVHPWFAEQCSLTDLDKIISLAADGPVGIGETGLDSKINTPVMGKQIKIFEYQLDIARQLNLPVIIHCRGAFNELIKCIKKTGMPDAGGIIHSFSGSAELAKELLRFGLNFSIGGILTYRPGLKRTRLLKYIYPDHFVLETDSPDILPVHAGDSPNVPANIIFNLNAAASILSENIESVAEVTTRNALRIFNI